MTTISERLRRGPLAYATTHSRVYAGPTLQDTEAADTIDALVAALARVRSFTELGGDPFAEPGRVVLKQIDAALAKAKGKQE